MKKSPELQSFTTESITLVNKIGGDSDQAKKILWGIYFRNGIGPLLTINYLAVPTELFLQLYKKYYHNKNLDGFAYDLTNAKALIVERISELKAGNLTERIALLHLISEGNTAAYDILFKILEIEGDQAVSLWRIIADYKIISHHLVQVYTEGFHSNPHTFIYALEHLENKQLNDEVEKMKIRSKKK